MSHDKGDLSPAGADVARGGHLDTAPGMCLPLCTEAAPGACGELHGMCQKVNCDNPVDSGLAAGLGQVPSL